MKAFVGVLGTPQILFDYGFTCPPRFMSGVCLLFVRDGRKLQFLSRAQSDWAETWWRPRVAIPD
jgi:hypothetical protein